MNTEYVVHATRKTVYVPVTDSADDLTGLDPVIALHGDNDTTDTPIDAEWDSVTATQGVAKTTAQVDFSLLALGQYLVRIKLGNEWQDAYRIKVIP